MSIQLRDCMSTCTHGHTHTHSLTHLHRVGSKQMASRASYTSFGSTEKEDPQHLYCRFINDVLYIPYVMTFAVILCFGGYTGRVHHLEKEVWRIETAQ